MCLADTHSSIIVSIGFWHPLSAMKVSRGRRCPSDFYQRVETCILGCIMKSWDIRRGTAEKLTLLCCLLCEEADHSILGLRHCICIVMAPNLYRSRLHHIHFGVISRLQKGLARGTLYQIVSSPGQDGALPSSFKIRFNFDCLALPSEKDLRTANPLQAGSAILEFGLMFIPK